MAGLVKTAETAYNVYKMQRKFRKLALGRGGHKDKVKDKKPKNEAIPSKPGPRGKLNLTVVAGRGLKSTDLVGKSDPYCIIELGDQKMKTRKISGTNDPTWNQEFNLDVDGEKLIMLRVMDKDRFKKDDLIGELVLKVKAFNDESWVDDWFELDTRGMLRLQMRFMPTLIGRMAVKVIEAKGLAKADVTGKADPYCIAKLGAVEEKTKKVKRSLAPKWNAKFDFNVRGETYVDFLVYDWDRASKDDIMGECIVRANKWEGGQLLDEWIELLPENRGSLHVQIQFARAAPEAQLEEEIAQLQAAHDPSVFAEQHAASGVASAELAMQSSPIPIATSTSAATTTAATTSTAAAAAAAAGVPPPLSIEQQQQQPPVQQQQPQHPPLTQMDVCVLLSGPGPRVLQHLDLRNSVWKWGRYEGVRLDGSVLAGVDISDCSFTGCSFRGAVLRAANLSNSTFTNCRFVETDFAGANLCGVRFQTNCEMQRVCLDDAHASQLLWGNAHPKKSLLDSWAEQ